MVPSHFLEPPRTFLKGTIFFIVSKIQSQKQKKVHKIIKQNSEKKKQTHGTYITHHNSKKKNQKKRRTPFLEGFEWNLFFFFWFLVVQRKKKSPFDLFSLSLIILFDLKLNCLPQEFLFFFNAKRVVRGIHRRPIKHIVELPLSLSLVTLFDLKLNCSQEFLFCFFFLFILKINDLPRG